MITTTSKAASEAVEHFLGRTSLRRSPRRDRLVEQIAASPRPRAHANKLLDKFGAKDIRVNAATFAADILDAVPFDPVFRVRVEQAREAARAGNWTKPQHDALVKVLRDAWNPWADQDTREAKAAARDITEAAAAASTTTISSINTRSISDASILQQKAA